MVLFACYPGMFLPDPNVIRLNYWRSLHVILEVAHILVQVQHDASRGRSRLSLQRSWVDGLCPRTGTQLKEPA